MCELLPLLYEPPKRPECVAAFREWARSTNPDVAYWNGRWKTSFSWDDFRPLATTERKTLEAWADHNRWFASIMQRIVPPMVEAIRHEKPGAVIGFHDFLLDPALSPGREDVGMPMGGGIDFASIGYYVDKSVSIDENLSRMAQRLDLCRKLYPAMPIFVGEIGHAVDVTTPEARRSDEASATGWFTRALDELSGRGIGYSVGCWRTVVAGAKESLSLIREDGTKTPMLGAIKDANRQGASAARITKGRAGSPARP
jgi:hypothetical protein